MTLYLHRLKGCAPAPLAFYLKALGILRLVGEQADRTARGWWQDEQFCLLTKLSREELESFFLEQYEPTPMLSPWNKGCGFFKSGDPGLSPLEDSQAERFERFRAGIVASRRLLDAVAEADAVIRAIKARTKTNKTFQTEPQSKLLAESDTYRSLVEQLQTQAASSGLSPAKHDALTAEIAAIKSLTAKAEKPPVKVEADRLKASAGYKRLLAAADRKFKSLKATLIPDCQRLWRGPHAEWLSAAVVLDEEGNPEWPALLGTGGNDGNLDFTNNFMQQLATLFDVASADGCAMPNAAELLVNSLWSAPAGKLVPAAIGQYQPGAAGGANSSTGFDGGNLVNAWDFIFMMEGAILFTSRATRRLDPNELSRASAPFAVRPHAAGFASPGFEKAQRGEQWMPLWSRPATLADVGALFGEARLQLRRQTANRPIDAARAICRLGTARGVEAFTRYGYLERNGQSTLAVPLGRISVRQQPLSHLIDDLAPWMDRLQRRARDKNAPARLVQAERKLADVVFAALTHDHESQRWQAILRAAVAIESLQATGTAIDVGPIPPLHPEWAVNEVVGDSVEVRLARALGSAAAGYIKGRPIDSVRHHWLPLERGARKLKTSDKRLVLDPRVVAMNRDPEADCAAVVDRRLIEAGTKGQRRLPLVSAAGCGASLRDLAALLAGEVDFDATLDLARAFMAVKWDDWNARRSSTWNRTGARKKDRPDEAWLALRLCCLARDLPDGRSIPAEPNLVRRLLASDAAGAIAIAVRRLRSVGIRPPLDAGTTDPLTARRWAAALVVPLDRHAVLNAVHALDPSTKGIQHA